MSDHPTPRAAQGILLLDDHPLMLDALGRLIRELEPGVPLTPVDHPDAALQALAGGGFRLALLDLILGEGIDGFDVLARIREAHPCLAVVVVSGSDRPQDVVRAIDLGAMGFVPKRAGKAEMRQALAMVLAGGVWLPPELPRLLGAEPGGHPGGSALREPGGPALLPGGGRPDGLDRLGLTPRQVDVLALMLRALQNKVIARELGVSAETVKDHVRAVLRHLGVHTRTEAVVAVAARLADLMEQQAVTT